MTNKSVDLFIKEEHAIIAEWLNVEPKCDAPDMPCSWDAEDALGYKGIYGNLDPRVPIYNLTLPRKLRVQQSQNR
jgi:hypothetical protein